MDNPYGKYVAGEDLLTCLEDTPRRIGAIVGAWDADAFERRYAPGKWSARQILVHLAQSEMVFANRLRFALAQEHYVVQLFDQDDWMRIEPDPPARSALEAYLALRQMNLALCRSLTPEQRAATCTHPEHGDINVDWVMTMFAGHERHHLPQLKKISQERLTIDD